MIGGDAPYDHEAGGDWADGPTSQNPQTPQEPQPLESSQPPPPGIEERAAGARTGPPPGPAAPPPPPAPVFAPAPASAPAPPEPTGDARVDAALSRFDELATAPVADHVEIFEDVHRRLQDVLAAVDEQPQVTAPEEPAAATPGPHPRPHPRPNPGPPNWGS